MTTGSEGVEREREEEGKGEVPTLRFALPGERRPRPSVLPFGEEVSARVSRKNSQASKDSRCWKRHLNCVRRDKMQRSSRRSSIEARFAEMR